MMSNINIATTIAQMPIVQGMAGAQVAHPEAQQVLAAQLAQQTLKEQTKQVQKVEKQEGSEAIKDEDERRRRRDQGLSLRKRRARQAEPEEEEEAHQPASSSPWLGHLINRKV